MTTMPFVLTIFAVLTLPAPAAAQSDGGQLVAEAQRLIASSNSERIAALEAILDRRGLPYVAQEFPARRERNGARSVGRNLVLTFGAGLPEIIVGAHADAARLEDGSLSHGMVDNAAGVVALLELAESLREAPPARQVRIVFFDMEELGLVGSEAFVSTLQPSAVAGMINVDIVGYGDTVLFGPDGSDRAEPPGAGGMTLADRVRHVCAGQSLVCVSTPRMPPSDDRSFTGAGIPSVSIAMLPAAQTHQIWLLLNGGEQSGLREGWVPEILQTIHTDRDTTDRLEPQTLGRAARLLTQLVRDFAADGG
ncbi:MAG: Zn-dependent exopeptidase M28 [Acidobacteria bacterium]|nr:Zn-dependent exopeptidase M28 [Acidobacteriota bacterium]